MASETPGGDRLSGPTGTYVRGVDPQKGLSKQSKQFVIHVIRDRIHTFCEIAYKKGFPRRTLWCRPPWRIWFSLCPIRPNFFFGRRCAAGRRSAPRARPESWPAVGGLASSVHAHRLALALASGQELRAWGSAKRQSAP